MPNDEKERQFIGMVREQLGIEITIVRKPIKHLVFQAGTGNELRAKVEYLFKINFGKAR